MRWDYDFRHTNGVRWTRWGERRYGLWLCDRRAPRYSGDDTPYSPVIFLRLPRWSVALLHPEGK